MSDVVDPQWWLLEGEKPTGPFSTSFIALRLQGRGLSSNTLACPHGTSQWRPLGEWQAFTAVVASPPAPPPNPSPYAPPASVIAPPAAALPEMAQAICVYSLFISPILWMANFASCFAFGPMFHPDSPLLVLEVLAGLAATLIGLATTVLLFLGALQLRHGKKLGGTLTVTGLAIDLAWIIINLFLTVILLLIAASDAEIVHMAPDDGTPPGFSCFFLLIGFVAFVFEIVALVWLLINKQRLSLPASS